MREDVLKWLRWLLPILSVLVLLGAMRLQFLLAVPLVIVALGIWLYLLPRPRVG